VVQRGPRETPVAAAPARKEKPATVRATAARQRLGYKRERALAELPKRIEALQGEMAALNAALADSGLYSRDAKAFAAMTARLAAAQAEVEAAETEWLELEMLREELEASSS
jgi:ATP-binding cassette subfamily F protein uup